MARTKRNAPGAATPEASILNETGEDSNAPSVTPPPGVSTERPSSPRSEVHVLSLALLLEVLRADPFERVSLALLERLAELDGLDGVLADVTRDAEPDDVGKALVYALEGLQLADGASEVARRFVSSEARWAVDTLRDRGWGADLPDFAWVGDGGPLDVWFSTVGELFREDAFVPAPPPHVRAGTSLEVLAEALAPLPPRELRAYVERVGRIMASARAGFGVFAQEQPMKRAS